MEADATLEDVLATVLSAFRFFKIAWVYGKEHTWWKPSLLSFHQRF